jgi:glycosyltransferase involved in cell wall biosynthesis
MILSTTIIVGNDSELGSLKRCIDSFIDYTDEIIILANGEEVKEIEAYCKTEPKIKYHYRKWNKNFGEQRNICASYVRSDADYYFWIDSDDVLVGAEHLRGIAEKALKSGLDAVFFTYWYGCLFKGKPSAETMEKVELTQMRERLLKPGTTIWKKRLHETPVPIENLEFTHSQIVYSTDYPIAWLHLGVYRNMDPEDQKLKTTRNRELLELDLDEESRTSGADPRTLIYLMKIYGEENDQETLERTLEMGNEYLTKSGWDAERSMCCCIMGKCLGKLGREEEAKEFLFKAIGEYPYDPMLYLYLAKSCGNLKQYREMKHWLAFALSLDPNASMSNITNILELKCMAAELTMHYAFNAEKNVKKAYRAMQILYSEVSNDENRQTLDYLKTMNELEEASRSAHQLTLYYQEQNNSEGIVRLVESMPDTMRNLPFARAMYNKHKQPKVWSDKEICYYATFGKPHLEHWDGNSLGKGLGGSETAVIRLAEEWTKVGWKVTVYGDPLVRTEVNGVTYLPYFEFNNRDYFNIFIQWRSSFLAHRIKVKKFLVDLHDLVNVAQFKDRERSVDKYMVKSKFHASLLEGIELEKIGVISNGIEKP